MKFWIYTYFWSNIFFLIHRFSNNVCQFYKVALYYTSERYETTGIGQMTFGELKKQVGLYYNALKSLGIQKGDRVVGYLPNCPEAIIGKNLENFNVWLETQSVEPTLYPDVLK